LLNRPRFLKKITIRNGGGDISTQESGERQRNQQKRSKKKPEGDETAHKKADKPRLALVQNCGGENGGETRGRIITAQQTTMAGGCKMRIARLG